MTVVQGVLTVARQEIKLRIRAGRWRWLLAAWCVVTGIVTAGIWSLARKVDRDFGGFQGGPFGGSSGPVHHPAGVPMYGGLMLFVLGLALLVVPALTAQAVNGDRDRGVLATLQVTLLSPLEIALGKLVAAWGVAVTFLLLTAPWVLWSYLAGGVPVARIAAVTVVVALLLGVFCATSLGLSSLLARTTTSAVLSYLTVFLATVGTLLLFLLGTSLTMEHRSQTEQVPTGFDQTGNPTGFQQRTFSVDVPRYDRVWWLLAPNPFVVLADAAPATPRQLIGYSTDFQGHREPVYADPRYDVLSALANAVREVRKDPVSEVLAQGKPTEGGPLWPTGLAVDVVIGAGAVWITMRRLRTPARKLPRGQRVA